MSALIDRKTHFLSSFLVTHQKLLLCVAGALTLTGRVNHTKVSHTCIFCVRGGPQFSMQDRWSTDHIGLTVPTRNVQPGRAVGLFPKGCGPLASAQ